jgi:hypothetical protein
MSIHIIQGPVPQLIHEIITHARLFHNVLRQTEIEYGIHGHLLSAEMKLIITLLERLL